MTSHLRSHMPIDIEPLVTDYLARHPDYELPAAQYRHPAVLALLGDIKGELMDRVGAPLEFWRAVLQLAQRSWQPGHATDAFRLFRTLFEAEGNINGAGRPELEALAREYNIWRKTIDGK